MAATNTPQDAARMMSRRRALFRLVVSVMSQRPHQHGGSLDQSDGVEQRHQHAERERDRDRARAAPALLLRGEHDAVITTHSATPSRTSRLSASKAANSTNT